jgi:hypothetical protein
LKLFCLPSAATMHEAAWSRRSPSSDTAMPSRLSGPGLHSSSTSVCAYCSSTSRQHVMGTATCGCKTRSGGSSSTRKRACKGRRHGSTMRSKLYSSRPWPGVCSRVARIGSLRPGKPV